MLMLQMSFQEFGREHQLSPSDYGPQLMWLIQMRQDHDWKSNVVDIYNVVFQLLQWTGQVIVIMNMMLNQYAFSFPRTE